MKKGALILFLAAVSLSCGGRRAAVAAPDKPVEYTFEVVNTYPHDPTSFTQGLFWHEGRLWESTGLYGRSRLREVELETGRVLREAAVENDYFAEGAAMLNGRIYQLTWQDGVVIVYDPATLEAVERFPLAGEGWGLTTDGSLLYMSNGTSRLTVVGPAGFERQRQVNVRAGRGSVQMLNELEWIDGKIWANIYLTDRIAIIDPATGRVEGMVDLGGLYRDRTDPEEVLNGIAHDPATGRIFVTGKLWPAVYEIKINGERSEP
jgi:glutamine cyclotransferase